jgi:GT2 family glycosyltransferase
MLNIQYSIRISIILLNLKDYDDTKKCINSVMNSTYPNYEIIVVDNFSNDGSVELLSNEFQNIKFIYNPENFGFSKGVNEGLKYAYSQGFEWFLILNNDMIVDPDFLANATKEIPNLKNIGAITGKILFQHKPNIFWQAGGHIDMIKFQGIPRGKDKEDQGQYDLISKTGWASGAMSLIPKKTIDLIGFLPEEYFFGQEEWDYSIAILNKKLDIYYLPNFKAFHKAGGSYKSGHPVLNIYGGYLNKMICAEKYLSPIMWKLWRIAFWLFLKFKWPILAKEGCQNEDDYKVKLRAGYMAFKDHKNIKYVGLPELESAARRLGPAPSWGNEWASN